MGNDPEKEKRHQHGHDDEERHDGHKGSMAASDDVRDVHQMSDKEIEKWNKEHDKFRHNEHDIGARVVSVSIEGKKTKVGFAIDKKKVKSGMVALLMHGDALLAQSGISDHGDGIAYGWYDLTPDMIHTATRVVINPSSIPKSASPHNDIKARIVGVSVIEGKTQIMIAMGTSHGVRDGMEGYCMKDDSGGYHLGSRFHIKEAGSLTSKAIVEMSVDEVYHLGGSKLVMINPKHMP